MNIKYNVINIINNQNKHNMKEIINNKIYNIINLSQNIL